MELTPVTALSPVDGRYGERTAELRGIFSEFGLFQRRLAVEIRWLQALAAHPDIAEAPPLGPQASAALEKIVSGFSPADAQRIKELEKTTNHDVKAMEYFLREKMAPHNELRRYAGFVHFACTSEDVNNLAHALMLKEAREQRLAPALEEICAALAAAAQQYAAQPMLGRTHGQPASPTTLGKELAVFIHRLRRQVRCFRAVPILGKMNGATGNFNAHLVAYPAVDWPALSQSFVQSLGLTHNPHTTQIESHDCMAEYFHALVRINAILLDLCRDAWGYIALDYFQQQAVAGETGSSTMPHKINPIDFENAEGNLGTANALLAFLAEKLPVSRWQRDLSDSTALRNMGTALAHCLVACRSCLRGLRRLEANPERINADLDDNPQVLAEALQTVMRRHGIDDAYEQLKELTRGQRLTRERLRQFIAGLGLPEPVKEALGRLAPRDYTGNAAEQAAQIISQASHG